ncbi:MAG: type II toxin-antitoxin system RelE/ParE family toxin [Bryobacteraceae bacterium]
MSRTFAITPRITTAPKPPAASRSGSTRGLSSLTQFPRRGRPGRSPGTRELVFTGLPFLSVYRVGDDLVEVDRILHGAQRWP